MASKRDMATAGERIDRNMKQGKIIRKPVRIGDLWADRENTGS
ncbi:MAG: hypothetical protein ACM3WV_08940 [Bacillota bacterium]